MVKKITGFIKSKYFLSLVQFLRWQFLILRRKTGIVFLSHWRFTKA